MGSDTIKFDCKYFKGDVPCTPNKLRGKVCDSCNEYSPISKRILIIKLGAAGDVLRSTPLAVRYRNEFPDCHITWLTNTPELLPESEINEIYKYDAKSNTVVSNSFYDIAANLDKDKDACILLRNTKAKKKFGFTWNENHIEAIGKAAQEKLLAGLFDEYSKKNKKSYQQEIFEMCGFEFSNEPYLLNLNDELVNKWKCLRTKSGNKKIVGLNTGCGKRWQTRLWYPEYWITLINLLKKNNFYPIILGGPDEHQQNLEYSNKTGVFYPGIFSLQEFIAITANCDIILTAVTMMMHIAIGLKKPLVLFNNIFNKNEFELYGRGVILEPDTGCDCYYGQVCTRKRHCMKDLSPEKVLSAILVC